MQRSRPGMVRYIYELNRDAVKKIYDCTTLDEIKSVIAEITSLMETKTPIDEYSFIELADLLTNRDITVLQYNVKAYISTSAVKHMSLTEDDSGIPKFANEDTDYAANEPYVILDSPYMLYNAWLINNGYIPKK